MEEMDAALRALAEGWRGEGREVHAFPGGIAVEFDDGADALFVMPGEPLSSVALEGEIDVKAVRGTFARVNAGRRQVTEAIRRYFVKHRMYVRRSREGNWGVTTSSGVSTTMDVGAQLTKLLVDGSGPAEAMLALFEGWWEAKPGAQEVQAYLEAGEGVVDLPWPTETPTIKIPDSPMAILRMSRAWGALTESEGFWDGVWKLVGPVGPEAKALRKMASLLKDTHAAKEISTGQLQIAFADGHASFGVLPKGKDLQRLVAQRGVEGAGEHLASEYRRLDGARGKVVGAPKAVMAERGYAMDVEDGSVLHFGRVHREIRVDVGDALTAALRDRPMVEAVRGMLGGHAGVAEEVVRRCEEGRAVGKAIEQRELPAAPPAPLELPGLETLDVSAIDAMAAGILQEFRGDTEFLWARYRPMYYQKGVDTWATDAMWQEAAQKRLQEEDHDSTARVILCELGDAELEARWMEELTQQGAHHEADAGQVMVIWRNRKRYPAMAREWFFPDYVGDSYTKVTADLGDPVAVRRLCIDYGSAGEEYPQWLAPATGWFVRGEVLAGIHERLRCWARTSWRWAHYVENGPLELAARMGWADVAELLEGNPYVARGLLDAKELPILHAGDLLLAWSWLWPNEYLMRLVGQAFALARPELVRPRVERLVGTLELEKQPDWADKLVRTQLYGMQRPLAIAWTRCRNRLTEGIGQSRVGQVGVV